MFVLVRLLLAAAGFFLRMRGRLMPWKETAKFKSRGYHHKINSHKGRIRYIEVSAPIKNSFLFKLTHEGWIDRACKVFGVATEFQSGKREFDERVYIASDQPALHDILRADEVFRENALSLLTDGFQFIRSDGSHLYARSKEREQASSEDLERFFTLLDALEKTPSRGRVRLADAFFVKALVVEAICWSLAAYALGAFLEVIFYGRQTLHLQSRELIFDGLLYGVSGALIFIMGTVFFLKGSSRSHRVIIESIILLLISLPIVGIQLLADINVASDTAPATVVEARVVKKERRVHRSNKGGNSYSYHLHLNQLSGYSVAQFNKPVDVSKAKFREFTEGELVFLKVKPGALGYQWLQEITSER